MAMPAAPRGAEPMAGAAMPDGMAGMDMGPAAPASDSGDPNMGEMGDALAPAFKAWGLADFAFAFAMWSVMMVGMMTPSVAPMVLLYAAAGRVAARAP